MVITMLVCAGVGAVVSLVDRVGIEPKLSAERYKASAKGDLNEVPLQGTDKELSDAMSESPTFKKLLERAALHAQAIEARRRAGLK